MLEVRFQSRNTTSLVKRMIFGFNTDVKVGDIVYHLQSEARKGDLLLETQVFLKGQCIGKCMTSYADQASDPSFTDEKIHELLKAQHKQMVDAARANNVASMFTPVSEIQDVEGRGLTVKWTNPDDSPKRSKFIMKFEVMDNGTAADGALLTSRLEISSEAPIHSQASTGEDGTAELEIALPRKRDDEPVVLISAKYGDKSATRKFRLKRQQS